MKYLKISAFAAAVLMLTSCSSAVKQESGITEPEETQAAQESAVQEIVYPEDMCMPCLSINNGISGEAGMNFVTEPTARFVAEQIITWDFGYKIPAEPYYETCSITLTDTDGTVLLDGEEAEVKVRGNWTTTYDKKPLRIKFTEKQNLLGLNNGSEMKNWVLLAEYKDASMLRNKTALQISGEILGEDGYYASDAELVEVYINGNYWGVYLLAELQQISNHRININEAEKDYTGTDIGYLLEFDGTYYKEDELSQFTVDYADNAPLISFNGGEGEEKTIRCLPVNDDDPVKMIGMTIKSDIYSQAQHDFISSFVNNVYRIMYSAAYENKAYAFNSDYSGITEQKDMTPQEAVEKVVDVRSLADMYIISELTCDADIYWSSFYMDADFSADGNKKLTFEAPWDFDSSMGNKNRCADGTGFYAASIVPDVNSNEYDTINPWLAVLMNQEWYRDIIAEKWTSVYDSGTFDRALEMIENDKNEYRPAFERNYKKWQNLGIYSEVASELVHEARICKSEEEGADYLHKWLKSRVEFLDGYWHSDSKTEETTAVTEAVTGTLNDENR